jgi:hypothetical protein
MQYDQLKYVPEEQDPSLTIETRDLVVNVIDNTGLLLPRNAERQSYFGSYGFHEFAPFTHHLGYHGIRTLYHRAEKRNLVVPFASWLNLQTLTLEGIENDPVDERAWAGTGRGWPIRMEPAGRGARLTLEPLPQTQCAYTIEFQPAEPDGIDFAVRFRFGRLPAAGPARFVATWPCYMNAYDDVRLFYPQGDAPDQFQWVGLGEKPDIVLGDPVRYKQDIKGFNVERQALPLAYGLIGERALAIMFDDPAVNFFVVNSGGHFGFSPVQNPAWDFRWTIENYPLDTPVGFDGRIMYARFEGADQMLRRYREWKDGSAH